jgi:hypothetical protein
MPAAAAFRDIPRYPHPRDVGQRQSWKEGRFIGVMSKNVKRKALPKFRDEDEERAFWVLRTPLGTSIGAKGSESHFRALNLL